VTLAATVREAAARFGDTPAFVASDGWTLSYAELDAASDRVAAVLAARGVAEGDLVALVLPSTPDYVVAYAAAAKLGAVTAGINPRLTASERAAVLDVARPALVVTTDDLAPVGAAAPLLRITPATSAATLFAPVTGGAPAASTPVAGGAEDGGALAGDLAAAPALDDPDDPDRVVAVVFTSGTTGRPKGAIFTNRELAAITASDVGDQWGGGGAMLASTQFAHVGFMTKLPWYLRLATTTYLLDRWRAADVLRLVSEHRMTSIGGVAPQVALMLRDPDFDTYDLSSVKTLIMGGALSPPALVREARERFGAAYSIRYSSTESGGVGTGTAFDADDDEAFFTVGRPRGDVQIEIRDDDDRPVPDGTVGELCLRSSCMMRGYWNDPEATAAALRDGWIHTGDLARIDERGLLRLAGRSKEMFIRGGYNVYPVEVESVLASHPAVLDVAVVPRADDVLGEVGVAVVVLQPGASPPTVEDLRAFAADRLAAYKRPEAVEVVDELPLTAMQKLDRGALRDRFGGPVDHTG
jgi:acyl-CoA synthetase (AMP-forming)/AMP-acid ligase II